MTEYISALMVCLQPANLLLIVAMVSLGIVFGAIPGLSATLGIALLLPVTFGLSTETSFVLLLAIWIGGVSGTFISAVLIGIPGSSSAIATCFDGFPMTKNGQASKALGIGMTAIPEPIPGRNPIHRPDTNTKKRQKGCRLYGSSTVKAAARPSLYIRPILPY